MTPTDGSQDTGAGLSGSISQVSIGDLAIDSEIPALHVRQPKLWNPGA
jgi:hypothetical protein